MKTQPNKKQALRKLLSLTHQEKESPTDLGPLHQNTMRAIRKLGAGKRTTTYFNRFEGLVWRLSPLAATMIVIFTVWFLNFELVTDADLFILASLETDEFSILQIINF
jgi:hypothetical protein